jgi:hypothetical protein
MSTGGPITFEESPSSRRKTGDGARRVEMRDSIVINTPAAKAFDFLSDGNNDPLWRTEVDRMDVQGERQLGTLMIEYSSFFRFGHTVTPTQIKELESPTRFVLETPDTNPIRLRSIRTVERISDTRARFTYELGFDLEAMKQVTPVIPPRSLVAAWYSRRIRRYLRNAKRAIEAR